MSGARLTRRLERLEAVRVPDGAGGFDRVWERRAGLWAEVAVRSGGARVTELGVAPRLRLRITVQDVPPGHAARPAPGDRLREGVRLYEVEAVHEAAPGRLACFAQEVTEGGGA